MRPIYLDFNSTTPVLPPVWEAMQPYLHERFGNPSSSHQAGRHARRGLDEARELLARLLDCRPDEILFTSGATEANNLAIFGLAGAAKGRLLASALEHPCVTEPLAQLARRGFQIVKMRVSAAGVAEIPVWPACPPEDAPRKDEPVEDLRLATLMLANHETGVIQPVREIVEQLASGPVPVPVHCDAAAAAGKLSISFRSLGVTTLALSAHKFHGPKGIGALLVRKGTRLTPQLFGGHQQHGQRPGTEPVALIVGMAKALEIAMENLDDNSRSVTMLRDLFWQRIREGASPVVVNGLLEQSLPYTLNLSFPGCQGDALLMKLDLAGVCCSTGSACSSGSLLPSPVIDAMGAPPDVLRSALRFSFSSQSGAEDLAEAARRIIKTVKDLRRTAVTSELPGV